jgi:hypothetical protein
MAGALAASGGGDVGRVLAAIRDPRAAYLTSSFRGEGSAVGYGLIFAAPFRLLALTLGVYFWRRLGWPTRLALVAVFLLLILGNVGASLRSGIVASAVITCAALGAALAAGEVRLTRIARAAAAVVLVAGALAFFEYTAFLAERREIRRGMLINPLTLRAPDAEHAMYRVAPERWHVAGTAIAFYLSHPYYRLGQALDMPFRGVGFGAGNSAFLMRNAIRLTGWERWETLSYGFQLDRSTALGQFGLFWSTMYTWIASDVTFPGSVLVVFLIGYLLALAWSDAVRWRSPLAVSAFAALAFLVFSFPMNNPFQDGAGITAYGGIPVLWWLTRDRSSGRRNATAPEHGRAQADEQ